ncbi:MAG: hypothetical protein MUO37_10225 [Methyloceanibacter sp.]|nr:hypothetical protein [Methyloceanibacter sp.]
MRGLAVAFLLLFWSSPAFPQAGQHGNYEVTDNDTGGHAIGSGEIAPGQEGSDGDRCTASWGGGLGLYACRLGELAFGSTERAVVTFTALLALSTLLLWWNTRHAVKAARVAAEHIPAVERAYVFGGPTDLFLLHDQATVRLAMQNYGKTPAVIRGWVVEFVAQEPRGRTPAYDEAKRTVTNEILEPEKLFSPATIFRSEVAAPFFVVGYIAYEDVFRHAHTTRFCVGVTRDGKAAYGGHAAWNGYD